MGKYNWWRRSKKQPPLTRKEALKGRSFFLQQIEHGDFDYSDYYRQAQYEKVLCKQEQKKLIKSWIAGPDSLNYRLDEIERKYIKRYNKLLEDHHNEETKMLRKIKEKLFSEFGVDVWDQAINMDWEQDLKTLFFNYKQLAQNESTRSKKTSAN